MLTVVNCYRVKPLKHAIQFSYNCNCYSMHFCPAVAVGYDIILN